jgi:hypothetical protein
MTSRTFIKEGIMDNIKHDYDSFNYLRDQLTDHEKLVLNNVVNTEFSDLKDEISEVYYKTDITLDFSKEADPIYQQVNNIVNEFYCQVLNLVDLEEDFINKKLQEED